ncbi:hypothetical protein AcV7_003579 [Taiwanofungus camphoratus]|nr:hypothetical protein AcV7_003579 [Antrodia cinnamomea]
MLNFVFQSGFILLQIANGCEILLYINTAACSTLRVYAIAQCNWQLSSIVFALGSINPAINIYMYSQQALVTSPPIYCVQVYSITDSLQNKCKTLCALY